MTSRISNAVAIAALNAAVDQLDNGAAAGYIEIRTGTQPAGVDVAATGTLLGTLTCSDPAFGNATDANPGATVSASTITSDTTADASGTAGWYRGYDSDANPKFDGDITVTAGGGDMELDDIVIVAGGTIEVTGWTVTLAEG